MAASSSSSTSCHILPNHGRGKQAVHGWGSKFESLLDKKVIAVIPSPGKMTVLTTWRCAVLDESKDKDVVYARGNGLITRVMSLDGSVLQFLNDNRPRRERKRQHAEFTTA